MGEAFGAIANNLGITMNLAKALAEPIEPAQFARLPGEQRVETNHPAFVYGHLSLYPGWLLGSAGLETEGTEVPESYEALFRAKAECLDDPEGTIYPAKSEIMEHFTRGHETVLRVLPTIDDARVGEPNPIERLRDRFPTLGSISMFLMTSHTMMHLGQISAWRRVMGYGSVF